MGIFALAHVLILTFLYIAAMREIGDTMPNQRPKPTALKVGAVSFDTLGTGYCRDDSMQRPDCYWTEWKEKSLAASVKQSSHLAEKRRKLASKQDNRLVTDDPLMMPRGAGGAVFLSTSSNKSSSSWEWFAETVTGEAKWPKGYVDACSKVCSKNSVCIGFAVDDDFCTIYNSVFTEAPAGWTKGSEHETRAASIRRVAHVIQTNKYDASSCWSKDNLQAEPQDMAGGVVYILHIFVVIFILGSSFRYMKVHT